MHNPTGQRRPCVPGVYLPCKSDKIPRLVAPAEAACTRLKSSVLTLFCSVPGPVRAFPPMSGQRHIGHTLQKQVLNSLLASSRGGYRHYSDMSTAICLHCQERLPRASVDLPIRSNCMNTVSQNGEKSTTGRTYQELGEKYIHYLIDLAINVITLTCLPPRLHAITPHHPPQSRPYELSGQWPQHQCLPSASAAPPGPVPGH